jgi:hypothetical protein
MATTTDTEEVKAARKPHECSWCGERIEKGMPYKRYRYFDGGDAGTVKLHPECEAASAELIAEFNEAIEFRPGDYPRGCWCDFDKECERCNERKKQSA